jgi:hypothetical protein
VSKLAHMFSMDLLQRSIRDRHATRCRHHRTRDKKVLNCFPAFLARCQVAVDCAVSAAGRFNEL